MPDPSIADEAAERLLNLVREGCPDAEIAVRLGSPIADVKARVERLMTRAGAETRSELLAWARSPEGIALAPLASPARFVGTNLEPRQAPQRARPTFPIGRVLSIVAAVLAPAVLVAAFLLWPGSDRETIRLAPAALPTVTAPSNPGGSLIGRGLREVAPGPFPAGLVLYILTGCASCDTPPTGVDRIWRDTAGELHTDTLFKAPEADGQYISTVWAAPDGAQMAVGVCVQGRCGQRTRPGHPERPTPDARVQLWWSTTGGATWEDAGIFPGSVRIVDQFIPEQPAAPRELLVQGCTRTAGAVGCSMRRYPSLDPVANGAVYVDIPVLTKEGVLRWEPPALGPLGVTDVPGWPSPERGYNFTMLAPRRWAMTTYEPGVDGLTDTKLSIIDGETLKLADQVIVSATTVSFGAWFRGETAVVMVEQAPGLGRGRTAAVIDMKNGVYQAIGEPFTSGSHAGRLFRVIAARPGPVAVAFDEGPCLPVMPVPGPVVPNGCLVTGEMVTVLNSAPYEGVQWVGVRMDNGVFGLLPQFEPHLRYVKPWVEPGGPPERP
ncbi:MAG: hypothetical protein ACKVVT_07555 [Dehalococcoidia bacterium]